jgi:hypothetical protein
MENIIAFYIRQAKTFGKSGLKPRIYLRIMDLVNY